MSKHIAQKPGIRRGITLMEVLASVFVLGVGLLGVLAVIPFGAFQVSKGRDAEHCSNMLAAARDEVAVNGLAQPKSWKNGTTIASSGGTNVFKSSDDTFDCSKFIMFDPLNADKSSDFTNIYVIAKTLNNINVWKERMRGQDDLNYIRSENARTKFVDNHILSEGKYTWFAMFMPTSFTTTPSDYNNVDITTINPVNVELIGCYNRVPGDEREVDGNRFSNYVQFASGASMRWTASSNSGVEELDLTGTKLIFFTWSDTNQPHGCWCRILSASAINTSGTPYRDIIVLELSNASLPSNINNARALIVPGALYHTIAENVTIQ